jgi:hypothetical protein
MTMSTLTDELLRDLVTEVEALTLAVDRLINSLAPKEAAAIQPGIGDLYEVAHKPICYEGSLPQAASGLRIEDEVVIVSLPDSRGDCFVASAEDWDRRSGGSPALHKVNMHCLAFLKAWSLRDD